MNGSVNARNCVGCLMILGGVAGLVAAVISCSTAPTAFIVHGPSVTGNDPPTLAILEPNTNITRGQGDNFLIRWTDTDRDSSAMISFMLVNTVTNDTIVLVQQVPENDPLGPDSFTVGTSLIPVGLYNILGIIDDLENPQVEEYAMTTGGNVTQRVTVTIVEAGQGPPTQPPMVTVTEPAFNLSVSQDDVLRVAVQPTALAPEAGLTPPFDADSDITLFILLDLDLDPNNDDPANPEPDEIVLLQELPIAVGDFDTHEFEITIDLNSIPPRSNGEPYYIRATVDDATNPRVHQYAVGTISVGELAEGTVDLFEAGRTVSGATFYGFNPGAELGSSISHIGDFDADGTDDFIMVAQFGNPRNYGLIGESYLVYGQDDLRFGGSLAVNTISETISGVIFEAPPMRFADAGSRTDGITDVSFIRDLSGDGRPEILFGLPHVHNAFESMDFDPGDSDLGEADTTADVEITIQQGETRITVDDELEDLNIQYFGVEDLSISSADPNDFTGSDDELSWQDAGAGQREWTLIKYRDVLSVIPDTADNIDVGALRANLSLRVFRTGGDGTLHQALTDFDEQTTFATFSGGGEPQGGEMNDPNADYVTGDSGQGDLGTVGGDSVEKIEVDVSGLVRELVDGLLAGSDNELRFIIVPSDDAGTVRTSARSSEFSIESDRPTLTIEYSRLNVTSERECYPDDIVNNQTNEDNELEDDVYFYSGGMALTVNSQNRDNSGSINTARLDSTVVTLELVGQEANHVLGRFGVDLAAGGIFARADNSLADPLVGENDQPNRISGSRIVAGPYDDVDARLLRQGPREGLFGQTVSSLGDVNNDGIDEIMISAPRNERYLKDLFDNFGFQSTQSASTRYQGSIVVIPGRNYNDNFWRDKSDDALGTAEIPFLDHHVDAPYGKCTSPLEARTLWGPADEFEVFAEEIDDMLGGARSAGDFNQDGIDDILCGAPLNDRAPNLQDTGAVYVLYGRNIIGSFFLDRADDPFLRAPMLRIRGVKPGDRVGWEQASGLDVNGDRVDDVFISSPTADFGTVTRASCAGDYDRDGIIDANDLGEFAFANCRDDFGDDVFSDDPCAVFDYNGDGLIDTEDETVFQCLADGGTNCCGNLVDNGFIGVLFGGVFIDGDRTIDKIATDDLPGVVFYGSAARHRAGIDVSSAGDFNQDGFGDILIAVPGESRLDRAGRERLGVVYLIFGGTHLHNTVWNLAQVGSADLPGIIFLSPYVRGRPNEAAPTTVAYIGDINDDGFADIGIGNAKADFIDLSFPQGPEATDAEVGRRRNAGDAYIIYGNNFGSNRAQPR